MHVLKQSILVILIGYALFIGVNLVLETPGFLGTDKVPVSSSASSGQQEVEKFLRDYTVKLAAAYAAGSPNEMVKLPVTKELEDELITDVLHQVMRGRTMKLTLKRMGISQVAFLAPTLASVRVHEVWDYKYEYKKGKTGPEGGTSDIKGVYTLQKTAEGWKVASFIIGGEGGPVVR